MNLDIIADSILSAIKEAFGISIKESQIPLHEPDFQNSNAKKYVNECIEKNWVSSGGEFVNKFERELCEFTKSKYAIATTNGTNAIRMSLYIAGVKPNNEVLMPSMSFVATANAVSHLGAIPHFVDIDTTSYGISSNVLKNHLEKIGVKKNNETFNKYTGRKIAAILPVHIFGNPANILEIGSIAKFWNLPIIEDAAEALGSWRKKNNKFIHCGLFGEIGAISFNGNKLITTGGGGAIITDNYEYAKLAKHLSTTAKLQHPWEYDHDQIGWNDRMPNINAALGLAQLENINETLKVKKEIYHKYKKYLFDIEEIDIIQEPFNCKSNFWLITIRFNNENPLEASLLRRNLLEKSHKMGIFLRPSWKPLHNLKPFLDCPKSDLKTVEDESQRLLNLPSSPKLLK